MNRTALTLIVIGAAATVAGVATFDWRIATIIAGLLIAGAGVAALDVNSEQADQ